MLKLKYSPVIEPAVIADVFASGILVEARDDIVRLTYYVEQHSWATEGEERVVVAKIVMARATVVELARMCRQALPELLATVTAN